MDKLADNLQHMTEDDLLLIVQMIHDKKSPETMTKNDIEREYHECMFHPRGREQQYKSNL